MQKNTETQHLNYFDTIKVMRAAMTVTYINGRTVAAEMDDTHRFSFILRMREGADPTITLRDLSADNADGYTDRTLPASMDNMLDLCREARNALRYA